MALLLCEAHDLPDRRYGLFERFDVQVVPGVDEIESLPPRQPGHCLVAIDARAFEFLGGLVEVGRVAPFRTGEDDQRLLAQDTVGWSLQPPREVLGRPPGRSGPEP